MCSSDLIDQVAAELEATEFRGYELLEQSSCVLALVVNGEPAQRAVAGDAVQVVLDTTPFYGEGGGRWAIAACSQAMSPVAMA